MIEDSPFSPRVVTCTTHRKERATHICTELTCPHTPILCSLCLSDPRVRAQHNHQASVRPLWEGVDWLTTLIRNQSKSIELIYQRTIGNRQCEVIKFNLEKGGLLSQELQNRLDNLKMQLEMEMELLLKQFQKQLQLQKIEFQRRLDQYHRLFMHNLEVLKRDSTQLLSFQHSLKYYNNANSFTLKLIAETERKSQDWILYQKRVLQRVSYILENPSFTSSSMNTFNRANKSNLFLLPYWKGEKRDPNDIERDIRAVVRSAIANWIQIPDLADLEIARPIEYTSNKYISYPISV